jgi:hypothetical protein
VWLGDIGRPFGSKSRPFRRAGAWARGGSAASVRRLGHHGVGLVPRALVNDRDVLAGIGDALVYGLANVDPVGEYVDDALPPGMPPAYRLAGLRPALEP